MEIKDFCIRNADNNAGGRGKKRLAYFRGQSSLHGVGGVYHVKARKHHPEASEMQDETQEVSAASTLTSKA
jgi:hypothetical protein